MIFTRLLICCALSILLTNCQAKRSDANTMALSVPHAQQEIEDTSRSYDDLLQYIAKSKLAFAKKYPTTIALDQSQNKKDLTDFWVKTIGTDLFQKWENTSWDFNGTATRPHEGEIACGYFVTTILRDMNLKINRVKLAICASSQMMRDLAPQQKLKNLSALNYAAFNEAITSWGKGVYIIGLDYHTGFVVNDGFENYFIHSSYIDRKGVVKEPILESAALRSSKTRWMITLTGDKNFLERWLRG